MSWGVSTCLKIRTYNWKPPGQPVSNSRYEFYPRILRENGPQNTIVDHSVSYEMPLLNPTQGVRSVSMWLTRFITLAAFFVMSKNESRAEREAAIVDLNAIAVDFDIEPIPSDPVRIPSQHQTQAKSILHDIAPPRIPSDPAPDPVCFAGSQGK